MGEKLLYNTGPGITGHNFTKIAWMLHLRIDDRGFKAFEAS